MRPLIVILAVLYPWSVAAEPDHAERPRLPAEHPCALHLMRRAVSTAQALLDCQRAQNAWMPPLPGPEAAEALNRYMRSLRPERERNR